MQFLFCNMEITVIQQGRQSKCAVPVAKPVFTTPRPLASFTAGTICQGHTRNA